MVATKDIKVEMVDFNKGQLDERLRMMDALIPESYFDAASDSFVYFDYFDAASCLSVHVNHLRQYNEGIRASLDGTPQLYGTCRKDLNDLIEMIGHADDSRFDKYNGLAHKKILESLGLKLRKELKVLDEALESDIIRVNQSLNHDYFEKVIQKLDFFNQVLLSFREQKIKLDYYIMRFDDAKQEMIMKYFSLAMDEHFEKLRSSWFAYDAKKMAQASVNKR